MGISTLSVRTVVIMLITYVEHFSLHYVITQHSRKMVLQYIFLVCFFLNNILKKTKKISLSIMVLKVLDKSTRNCLKRCLKPDMNIGTGTLSEYTVLFFIHCFDNLQSLTPTKSIFENN